MESVWEVKKRDLVWGGDPGWWSGLAGCVTGCRPG
jgi:hypothetical protein